MLKQMREGAKSTTLKVLLFGLLLMAMTGLALMDVQGMFRRGVSSNTILSIGREKMSAPEFDRIVQSTLREQRIKQSDAYRAGLPQQVLRREVDTRLFSKAALDLGLQADDVLAAKQVKDILAPLVKKGVSEKEALQRILQNYGYSEDQMVAMIKDQLATQQLLSTVVSGVRAPQQLIGDALKYRHESRRGEYFVLTSADAANAKPAPDTELKAYYDSIAGEYALPEYRTLSVIVLDKKTFGDEFKISADTLKQYYDDNISDYKSGETRVISQAVAADEESAKKIYAAAEKNNKDLRAAAAAGKGSYVSAGHFTEKAMLPELAKVAFAAGAGKVLPPVKSPMGWHVLYVESVVPATTKSFASVKGEIEKEISQDKLSEALYQRANKVDDEIAGGKTLSEVAREYKIKETLLEKIDAHGLARNGKKPDTTLPLFDKLVETGFSLKKGGASQLIETPDGSFVIVGVEDVFPSEQQSFDKVRANVQERWSANERVKFLSAKSAKITERLKNGESFSTIAAEFKKPVQSTGLVQRGDKGKAQESLMSALFSLDGEGHATAVSGNDSVTILRLAERKISAPGESDKKDSAALAEILNRSLKQDFLDEYRMSLIAKYNVSINEKLMSEMYTPKDDNGGGDE